MTTRTALAALTLAAGIGLPHLAGAQSCDSHRNDFDPQSTTAVVDGLLLGGGCAFLSPENTDPYPFLVWHVGDPVTLDGCIGGIAPGSGAPTGQLEMWPNGLICLGVDVETTTPYTAQLFDPGGVLVSSVIGSAPSYELPFRYGTWTGYRVVLTPGTLPGGGRAALCVDNLRVMWEGVPVRARTWGAVKTIYR